MHIKKVLKLLSYILFFVGIIMLVPAVLAVKYGEQSAFRAFLNSIFILILCAFGFYLPVRKIDFDGLTQKDGFLFTSFTWIFVSGFGALPLVFTKTLPNYSDAFFEIISGFTTTGATRIIDVESVDKSILFWRSLTNWLGGMGIVVLFVAILPALGTDAGTFNLVDAETVGPVKGKLTPKTKKTAEILWLMYIGVTIAQTILLLLGGLNLFDSVTITFSTVSTAVFGTKNDSIGAYNSPYIEIVVTIFMLIASINFSVFFKMLNGKIKEAFKDTELKFYLLVVFCASIFGAIFLSVNDVFANFGTSLRKMTFHIASIISTTGFTTAQYMNWPTFCIMLLIGTMFIGGCAGSTGGGIKAVRVLTVFKAARISIKRKIHPNSVYALTINEKTMGNETIFSIFSFCAVYIVTWLCCAVIISLANVSIQDCLSSTLLTLGNIGAGFGYTPFAEYPHWCNWIFSFLMLIGRLELSTVYVMFSKTFWKR